MGLRFSRCVDAVASVCLEPSRQEFERLLYGLVERLTLILTNGALPLEEPTAAAAEDLNELG